MLDEQGRRLVWGWFQERYPAEASLKAGWSGVMSLPKMLWLDEQEHVRLSFVPELAALRQDYLSEEELQIDADGQVSLDCDASPALEIIAEFEDCGAMQSGLILRRSPDGSEETRLYIDWQTRRLVLDRKIASQMAGVDTSECSGALLPEGGKTVRLHVYLDHSVIEAVADDYTAITARIYPTRKDSTGLYLFSQGGPGQVKSLNIWTLKPIW